jgi:hypothetical protein
MVFYGRVRNSKLAAALTRYIPPLICGMLLSSSCSILYECLRIMTDRHIHPWLSLGSVIGWVVLLFLVARFKRVPDPALLLLSACVSLVLV